MNNFILIGRGGFLTATCLQQLVNQDLTPKAVFIQDVENSPYINLTELICINQGIYFVKSNKIQNDPTFAYIKQEKPDFAIVASLGEIIKKDFLDLLPIYNVHMGVLPYFRGAYTNFWKILQGDDDYGVTVHKMEEKVDSGNALVIKEKNFSDVVFASDFFKLNYLMAAEALVEAIDKLVNGEDKLITLDYADGNYYRKHNQNDLILSEDQHVVVLHKKINRLQYYGVPELLHLKVYSSNVLLEIESTQQPRITKVNENKYLLVNKTGILELNTL